MVLEHQFRSESVQSLMRTLLIVFEFPFKGGLTDLIDVIKKIRAEKFKAESSVESFSKRVLSRFSGLDKFQFNLVFSAHRLIFSEMNSGPLSMRIAFGSPFHATA